MNIRIKDPVSAATHFIAMLLALIAATPLLIKASEDGELHLASLAVFSISMVFALCRQHHLPHAGHFSKDQ